MSTYFIPEPEIAMKGEAMRVETPRLGFSLYLNPKLGTVQLYHDTSISIMDYGAIVARIVKGIVPSHTPWMIPRRLRHYKHDVYTKVVGKKLLPFYRKWRETLPADLERVHKALYSVRGKWPSATAVRAALALRYPNDLFQIRACRLACAEAGRHVALTQAQDWNWMDAYEPVGKVARRALYRVPGGVWYTEARDVIQYITQVPFPHRRRWILLALAGPDAVPVVERSSDAQINKGFRILARHLQLEGQTRKHFAIRQAWRFMLDAPPPESPQATVVRYAQHAIRWHAEARWRRIEPGNRHFPTLQIQPPDGFRYIDNSDDLVEEGLRMHHCVGVYSGRAASGKSFIFNYRDAVTLEVSPEGEVIQAYGPYNSRNDLVLEAQYLLQQWCDEKWPDAIGRVSAS